ncbi:sirohydrochlorin chelatase [Roseibium sp.]|uniref:sirohydrochlorin chelatase n=1 Tax=Roseibium sp. TaxID=1936156 RepID=UPI003B52F7DA
MSGTRLPSQRAPATEALIVSHGQPSDPQAGEDQLRMQAEKIQALLPGWHIRSATLAAPGALEQELDAFSGKPFLFPMFMADGWFINTALPKRLGDREVHQLSPLGVLPGLPHQTVKYLKAEAKRRNWSWNSCDVMIAAHGSVTGPAAAECANYFARRVQTLMTFKQKVRTGFLAEEPFLSQVARFSTARTLLLPFLAGVGSHLTDDIPEELEKGKFRGVLLPPVGEAPFVPKLIAHSLKSAEQKALNFDPMNKERLVVSFAPPAAASAPDPNPADPIEANKVSHRPSGSKGRTQSAAAKLLKLLQGFRSFPSGTHSNRLKAS